MSNEPIEELTEQDIADLEFLNREDKPVTRHTLLELWTEVLSNIESQENERVGPGIAQKLVASWPEVTFKDVPAYFKLYYGFLKEQRQVVRDIVEAHPEALEHMGDDDAEENRELYLEILFEWNVNVLRWEAAWNVSAKDAAVRLAAIFDAQNMFLGQQGLVAHLQEIKFQFSEEDRLELATKLEAAKEEL